MGAYPIAGKTRAFFILVAYISLAMIVAIMAYALYSFVTDGIGIIGSSLVQVEFPPWTFIPVHAKPITLLYAASLVLLYTTLELSWERTRKFSTGTLHLLKLAAFGVGSVAFFELVYNAVFWGSIIAAQAILGHLNPDTVANPFPDLPHPINSVFASKVSAATLIGSIYVYHYFTKVQGPSPTAESAGTKGS